MNPLLWILGSGLAMTAIALVGSIWYCVDDAILQKMLTPLVAFAAGSLLGGAFFHMLPEAIDKMSNSQGVWLSLMTGFLAFFILEQFLHWQHSHHPTQHRPLTYLILIGDGLHNFIGGASVGATFLIDIRLGITAWFAAAAHEIPQELGDFAVLIHGGWSKSKALAFNFLSAMTFPLGGLLVYFASAHIDVITLVPFAAGNFIYIASADLIPEVKHASSLPKSFLHLLFFLLGLAILFSIRLLY